MSLSTHVLDATTGRPATGVAVTLRSSSGEVAAGVTDDDGRIGSWPPTSMPVRIGYGSTPQAISPLRKSPASTPKS